MFFNNIFYLAGNRPRDLDIRLRPVRTKALQRTPRQTGIGEHRPETYPFRLGRQSITSGVHLQRLPPPSQSLPQQPKQRRINTSPISAPTTSVSQRDGYPRQSAVVRQLYRLGSLERTNASIGTHISRSACKNQCYDEETGLHYNLMRYYEPETGRFVKYSYSLMIKGKVLWIEKYF